VKIVIYQPGGEPIEIHAASRIRIVTDQDHFEMRAQSGGLLIRLEEHDGGLAGDLAMFPREGNGVLLKGGLR
jgi:hypothetical protein